MLKTKIKASAVNNLTDARYFAAREVEWLGFRFSGDPEAAISLMAAKAIAEWVDGVKLVGEFDFATVEEIVNADEQLHFDAVQVGMYTPAETLEKLPNLTFIKEVVVENDSSEAEIEAHLAAYASCCGYFLLDYTKAGINWDAVKTGKPLSLNFLKRLISENKILLALDFQASEAQSVIETLHPEGLSLTGGTEEKVGFKSFDELDEIFDKLEYVG